MACRYVVNNSVISLNGGNGGIGFNSVANNSAGAGGGGGGGGQLGRIYDTWTGNAATVSPGTGAAPRGWCGANLVAAQPANLSNATNANSKTFASSGPANATDLYLIFVHTAVDTGTMNAGTLAGTNGSNSNWTSVARVTYDGPLGANSAQNEV